VVATVLAVLLVTGVGVGAWLLLSDGGDEPSAAATESEGSPTTDETGPTAPESAEPRTVTCWDDSVAPTAAGCGKPNGVEGLRWVYPSFDPETCPLVASKPARQFWVCTTFDTPSGQPAQIRYTWWHDPATGRAHYESKDRPGETMRTAIYGADGDIVRYVWRYPGVDHDGQSTMSSMFVDLPYSMSVDAANASDREAVFKGKVRFRAPEKLTAR
jgi:hypothetical protein